MSKKLKAYGQVLMGIDLDLTENMTPKYYINIHILWDKKNPINFLLSASRRGQSHCLPHFTIPSQPHQNR